MDKQIIVCKIVEKHFKNGDSLSMVRNNGNIVDTQDLTEALCGYFDMLIGSDKRHEKSIQKKISEVQTNLTKKGSIKFDSCKINIKNYIDEKKDKTTLPSIVCPSVFKSDDAKELISENNHGFIMKMQKWGTYPDTDRRYYLHMVFRFYVQEYHRYMVEKNLVLFSPSFHMILDILYPNGCKSCFPPEFKTFLLNSGGNIVNITTLPVPSKECSKNVKYGENFENISEVSYLRRFIYEKYQTWISGKELFYPSFLYNGNVGNDDISRTFIEIYKSDKFNNDLHMLDSLPIKEMEEILDSTSNLNNLYDDYMNHSFVTTGEQLIERMNFF